MLAREIPQFVTVYLRIIAVITFGLGICLIFWPKAIIGIFFSQDLSSSEFFVRMLGSTLVGYATLNVMAARDGSSSVSKLAVWSNLVTLLIASVVTLAYKDNFDNFGWLIIAQHILFATGFLYLARELSRVKK